MEDKKHEWRKHEKEIYLPKAKPVIIDVPSFKYITVDGQGNPNGDEFQKCVEALYSLSYGIKMSYKKGIEPKGFFQYTVYPLEGVWDLNEQAKKVFDRGWKKEDLVYTIMMRQPEFATQDFFSSILEMTKKKKPNEKLLDAKLIDMDEGKCCQMLHLGSYDDEKESFDIMEKYCEEQGLERASKKHKEIYLSDPRKTETAKLKTVLRFKVK